MERRESYFYTPFPTFVFRTPHISFQQFAEALGHLEADESYWHEFLKDKILQEAIFLATPVLYEEIQKFLAGTLTVPKEVNKLKMSVMRYYTRMSARCTPFGLFAGFSLGEFGDVSEIVLSGFGLSGFGVSGLNSTPCPRQRGKVSDSIRYTRLDMNYLCNLAQDICKLPEARKHLRYYPNSSLYPLGERLRYVEYYYKNARRIHNINAVDNSEYMDIVLEKSRTGAKIEELAKLLVVDDITLEAATAFINELIDSQILISELEPAVTGKDFLIQLSAILQSIPAMEKNLVLNEVNVAEKLKEIAALLSEIDATDECMTNCIGKNNEIDSLLRYASFGMTGELLEREGKERRGAPLFSLSSSLKAASHSDEGGISNMPLCNLSCTPAETGSILSKYVDIENVVKELGTTYEAKFLFQTDMFKPVNKAVLDKKIIQNIQEALELMNKISIQPAETLLSKFAENYYERYEDCEMPLLQVLDTENGIGYRPSSGDISPLIEGYVLPARQSQTTDIKWNRIQSVLLKKFLEATKNNVYSVEIEEKDFDFLTANWDDLASTLPSMCEIFSNKEGDPLILVHGSGGSSAANLLGRFCHVNQELENYVNEITAFEQAQNPDVIYAEIVHLPESRTGNILLRPVLRPYEIPYLSKPSVSEEFQIPLSDLYVSVKGKNIFLHSKRLNKRIIPRLSTAHNFGLNSMPVYHFLCDMQTQGLRSGIGFSWGSLSNEYLFLPRVLYKNVVLSLAKWTIQVDDFTKFVESDDKNWLKEKQLPRYVVLPDGDNELFVDMESRLSVQTLLSVVKKRKTFQLEEFPFDPENALVKDESGNAYTNEFVFGFYKSQKNE